MKLDLPEDAKLWRGRDDNIWKGPDQNNLSMSKITRTITHDVIMTISEEMRTPAYHEDDLNILAV